MTRKTHRRKSHRRRYTRKSGGSGCGTCSMRGQFGGRGGMGGAELGHAYTTGASQALYQMTGQTPGLSSGGGSKATKKRRQAMLAAEALQRNANRERQKLAILAALAREAANEGARRTKRRTIANRHNKFRKAFVTGMPIMGYEGNEYGHLSRNEMKNKIREEALSEYVRMFDNNEGFNEFNLELNNNNN